MNFNFLERHNLMMAHKKDRVMIVDDEEFCLSSIQGMIEKTGFDFEQRVDFSMTGLQALTKVKDSFLKGVTYKLILMDFNMPEMDGLESTLQIRNFFQQQQVSAKDQPFICGVTGHAH